MSRFDRTEKFRGKSSGKFGRRDTPRSVNRGSSRFGRRDDAESSGSDNFRKKPSKSGNGFELFQATCDSCGAECDLPFKPTGNKPVYCRSCFRKKQEGGSRDFEPKGRSRDFEPRQETKSSSDDLEKINKKLDKIMRALKID